MLGFFGILLLLVGIELALDLLVGQWTTIGGLNVRANFSRTFSSASFGLVWGDSR